MYLTDFKFHRPTTLIEAIQLLDNCTDGVPIAGGTDLLVEIKKGLRYHPDIISLSSINDLKSIQVDENYINIGSGLTHNELISSDELKKTVPYFQNALSKLGSEQVRNRGTIGGNLCSGASCCDSAPILISLNTHVEICNVSGVRKIPVKDLFIQNRQTILKKGDIMTKIIIPKPSKNTGAHFEKFGLREAASISVVSVAAMVQLENNICVDACIVIGAVAPTTRISQNSTQILKGKSVSELYENSPMLEQIGIAAANDSVPIDDLRGGAQYRRDILKVITQRTILQAIIYAQNNMNQ